ncbi:MAG: Uma2 family endonuclease [Planctomycetes bacterium]|nr:Uma2 family endonuclease [Planctomycetota bacterium]
MPTELPSGDIKYELDRGRLIIVSPPVRRHGKMQGRIVKELISQGEEQGLGEAGTETAFVLGRNPATVYIPDVHFIARRSFPVRETREGYLETAPDVAVEVLSKHNRRPKIDQKVTDYLACRRDRSLGCGSGEEDHHCLPCRCSAANPDGTR